MFSLGIVGAGQFSGQFAKLFLAHPGVGDVYVTDLLPERAERARAPTKGSRAPSRPTRRCSSRTRSTPSRSSPSAGRTARWSSRASSAGKHVYSAVPMAITAEEIAAIIDAVQATGLTYMMGETSQYNPATVYARNQLAEGAFGRIFYAEGDYVHDMDLGFYEAYQYSGGEDWKATASYPPAAVPDALGRRGARRLADARGERVSASASSTTAATASSTRRSASSTTTSPTPPRCSSWRAAARSAPTSSAGSATPRTSGSPVSASSARRRAWSSSPRVAFWQDKNGVRTSASCWSPSRRMSPDDPSLQHVAPDLRAAFTSGSAPVHDRARLPRRVRRRCTTGTRAATTSSSTTSSAPSTPAPCRR